MSLRLQLACAMFLEQIQGHPGETTVGEKRSLARECAKICGIPVYQNDEGGVDPNIAKIVASAEENKLPDAAPG